MKRVFWLSLIVAANFQSAFAEEADTVVFKNMQLENVIVTGSRQRVDPQHLPFTVTRIDRQQITSRYTASLLTVINEQVPGYFSTSRGILGYGVSAGAAGGMSIRGVGGTPTTGMMVLIDGHPQYMGLMGHPIADAYQSFLAERVEVLRGPASVLYGSNAMGGVINIVTRQNLVDGIKTNLRIGAGSYGTLTTEATNMIHYDRFSSIVSASYNRTDGHRKNSEFDQKSGFAKLSYRLSNHWNATTDLNLTQFNASNPGPATSSWTDNNQNVTRGVASAGVEDDYNTTSGAVKLFYNWGQHKINDGYGPMLNNNHPREALFYSRDHVWGLNTYQSFHLCEGNRTTLGFDYMNIGGRAWNQILKGGTVNLVDTTEYEVAGYVDFQQDVLRILTVDLGARWDYHSQADKELIPQLGVVARLSHEIQLKGTMGKGFRNPTLRELFMFTPKNPTLKAERLWNYELAFSQRLIKERLQWGVNLYLMKGDNMIQMVQGTYQNSGPVENWGIEFESRWQTSRHLAMNANYSYIHARYDIVGTPKHKAYVGADYAMERWAIETGVQWINQLITGVTPKTTSSYVLWNARATYRVSDKLSLYVNGENLLAQQYEVIAGYPMPRTTFMGGMTFRF